MKQLPFKRLVGTLLGGGALVALAAFAAAPANASPSDPKADGSPTIQQLNDTKAELDELAGSKGTVGLSWGVDPDSKAVVVSVPQNHTMATETFVDGVLADHDNVEVQTVPAAPRPMLGPGDAILTGGSRCSASAIGVGDAEYVVTAGHCTEIGTTWTTADGATIGDTAASEFPGSDYGTIEVTGSVDTDNGTHTEVGEPPEGTAIEKAGSTTGVTSGTIVGYGRTVNYAEGTVYDMIETDACVQPGDSGGSLYAGSTAVGITSGGTIGGCSAGFQSFFQPLGAAMDAESLTLK